MASIIAFSLNIAPVTVIIFSSLTALNFPVAFVFGQFLYDMIRYEFLYIYPAWASLRFLIYESVYFISCRECQPLPLHILPQSLLSLLFWDSSYIYIMPPYSVFSLSWLIHTFHLFCLCCILKCFLWSLFSVYVFVQVCLIC